MSCKIPEQEHWVELMEDFNEKRYNHTRHENVN